PQQRSWEPKRLLTLRVRFRKIQAALRLLPYTAFHHKESFCPESRYRLGNGASRTHKSRLRRDSLPARYRLTVRVLSPRLAPHLEQKRNYPRRPLPQCADRKLR